MEEITGAEISQHSTGEHQRGSKEDSILVEEASSTTDYQSAVPEDQCLPVEELSASVEKDSAVTEDRRSTAEELSVSAENKQTAAENPCSTAEDRVPAVEDLSSESFSIPTEITASPPEELSVTAEAVSATANEQIDQPSVTEDNSSPSVEPSQSTEETLDTHPPPIGE